MKWVTCRTGQNEQRPGLVLNDSIHLLAGPARLIDLLGDDGERMAAAAEHARNSPEDVIAYDEADLASPIHPPQLRDFLTFLDHLRNVQSAVGIEMEPAWNEIPGFYFSNVSAITGPNDPVAISPGCTWFDYELEVAAIIGTECRDVHPDKAADHIVGFTIFCDWSARDLQMHEMKLGLGPAKGKDGANTLGPMLVTVDELEQHKTADSYHLEMAAYVGDSQISHGWMDQMDWSWGEIVAYASRGTTLHPGEAIGSGTVPTGCLFEHFATQGPEKFPGWLKPGDVVRLEVEILGATRQQILPAPPIHRLRTGH
ncbi:MAG: fumarylacetoacetate hydrolase family protein [Actinobacteria bacterium]|nr:fumarylacetoacetate hydrolase family protein [Actinomycetota bacterium]